MTFDAFSRYLALETASRQVCVQPRPLTLRDAAAFAAERRRLLHSAHSAPAAVDRWDRQTDRRMDGRSTVT